MTLVYRLLFPAMWLAWGLYWRLASHGTKATERKEPWGSRLSHILPLVLAAIMLWPDHMPIPFLNVPLFARAPWQFWVAALVTATGLVFTAWARVHLGRNWSGTVTIKQDHELIMTGPYAFVRHPIYTGLVFAFIGTGFARGDWRGVVAIVLAWAALSWKLRIEERWMSEQFGERYQDYKRRVPALVPFWPLGRGP
jgi:protein-S-isoprenylcysteine O-methyltransferase Ste14